jgi:hypothetical protein
MGDANNLSAQQKLAIAIYLLQVLALRLYEKLIMALAIFVLTK